MIRTKKEANLISYDSEDEEEDDDDLEAFLAKYNIEKEYAPTIYLLRPEHPHILIQFGRWVCFQSGRR